MKLVAQNTPNFNYANRKEEWKLSNIKTKFWNLHPSESFFADVVSIITTTYNE